MFLKKYPNRKKYYIWFGVPIDCELSILRERFKSLILIFHPDRKGGDASKFQEIEKIYRFLYTITIERDNLEKRKNINLETYVKKRNENIEFGTMESYKTTNMTEFHQNWNQNRKSDLYDEGRGNFLKNDSVSQPLPVSIITKPDVYDNGFVSNLRDLNAEQVNDFSTYVNRNKNKRNIACFDVKHVYKNKESIGKGKLCNTRNTCHLNQQSLSNYEKSRQNGNQKIFDRNFYRPT